MIRESVERVRAVQKNMDALIKRSGYKVSHVYGRLGMDRNTFYHKRKNGTFTMDQMARILDIIHIEDIEDQILLELSLEDEHESDGVVYEWKDVRQ